ncbi:acyltransferase [Novosphingobium resinovorum]|uniref:acyltransferase n=1 Tax=Novosphingobium resinovorum TaxID=158500 RepID=UPI002ED5D81D|nr:acyltransferase [Novosphingobium resinovorum]
MIRFVVNKWMGLVWKRDTVLMRFVGKRLGATIGTGVKFAGWPVLVPAAPGSLRIGDRVVLASRAWATALGVSRPVILRCLTPDARIDIGDDCGLSGTVVCAAKSITIGKRCLMGADVTIFDTDFHPHEPENRRYAQPDWNAISAPVIIGDDVFIGTGAVIQKGVTIGDGAIVAARSVVLHDVPAKSVVAGVPAKVIRTL